MTHLWRHSQTGCIFTVVMHMLTRVWLNHRPSSVLPIYKEEYDMYFDEKETFWSVGKVAKFNF